MTVEAGAAQLIVGRSDELAELHAAYERSISNEAVTLFVSGEPGIGKTWLLDHFAEYVRSQGGLALRGNCYEDAAMVPYAPFVEALRDLARSNHADPAMDTASASAGDFSRMLPGVTGDHGADRGRLPYSPGHEERLRVFDAVARALVHPTDEMPVVLLLDDLHWADEPSALLLRYVARTLRTSRFMIVGAYRDTDLDTSQPFESVLRDLQREHLARRIALHRLTIAETREMIARTLESSSSSIASSAIETIQHESEGVPFFIEELILHLREEHLLTQRTNGLWDLASGAETAIPQSIRSVVGHRLDHISAPAREALGVASVIGREFSFDILLEVLRQRDWEHRDRLLDYIDEAMARRVIVERQRVNGENGAHFMFAHEQIHAVLYAGLNAIRRRALHQMTGTAIERIEPAPHRLASRLAYHFTHGEDLQKAARYMVAAAEQAARLRATGEAIHRYDSALEILDLFDTGEPQNDEEFRILLARDVLYETVNQRNQQVSGVSRLLTLAGESTRSDWQFEAHYRSTRFAIRSGDLPRALDHAQRARRFAEEVGDHAILRAEIGLAEARTGRLSGEPSRLHRPTAELAAAARHLTHARELGEQMELTEEVAWITQELGVVLWALADQSDADARSRARSFLIDALERFRGLHDRKGEITALIALAYRRPIAATSASGPLQGSFVAFLEEIRRLRQTEHLLTRESDRPRMEALSLLSIHTYSRTHGWYETAINRARDALDSAVKARDSRITLLARLGLSETERLIGRPARALEHANHAAAAFEIGLANGMVRATQQEEVLGAQALAHASLGSLGRAEDLARRRLALARSREQRPALAEAAVSLAEILTRAGNSNDAAARFARETLDSTAGLPGTITWDIRALLVLAEVALRHGDVADALDQASTAASRVEARDISLRWLVTASSLMMARVLESDGHLDDARNWFERSLELVENTACHFESDALRSTYLTACPQAVAAQEAAARFDISIASAAPAPQNPRPGGLTTREQEVLSLVAAGKTNREISGTLFISEKTVARHLTNIFNKIDSQSRTQAAAWAFRHGIA